MQKLPTVSGERIIQTGDFSYGLVRHRVFTGMAGGQATDEGIKTNSYYGGGGGEPTEGSEGRPDKPAARGVRALSRTGGEDAVNAFVTLLLKIWGVQNMTKKMAKQCDRSTLKDVLRRAVGRRQPDPVAGNCRCAQRVTATTSLRRPRRRKPRYQVSRRRRPSSARKRTRKGSVPALLENSYTPKQKQNVREGNDRIIKKRII